MRYRYSRIRVPEALVLTGALVGIALVLDYAAWFVDWDLILYDLHMQSWSQTPSEDILFVAIDEPSLRELGRWPWSRRIHARLLDKLSQAGARVVGFNLILSEPDRDDPDADLSLAHAMKRNGRVILPVLPESTTPNGRLKETKPLPAFIGAVASLGHVDLELDHDGVIRAVFLKAGLGSPRWSQFASEILRQAGISSDRNPLPGLRSDKMEWKSPGKWVRNNKVLIRFAGPNGTFKRISYKDVLDGTFSATELRDKFVLIGASAAGLHDALPTPVSGHAQAMPGTELLANILDSLMNETSIQPLTRQWQFLLTAILVLLAAMSNQFLTPRWALLTTFAIAVAIAAFSMLLLRVTHSWFAPVPALLATGLCYPAWLWRRLEYATKTLFEQKKRVDTTLKSIADGVISTDRHGTIEYMNPAAQAMTGCPLIGTAGRSIRDVVHLRNEQNKEIVQHPVEQCQHEGRAIYYPENTVLFDATGMERAVQASASPIIDQTGHSMGVVFSITDVSAVHEITQQMAHQASHDPLTGLPNRMLLRDRFDGAIARANRAHQLVVLLFLDLDRFKTVNDALGHTVGDHLLMAVAERLSRCSREEDTVARLGGDEFVFLLENVLQEEQISAITNKICEALEPSFLIDGHEFYITGSIGVSLYPKDGKDATILLKNADAAMYRAKESGRNNVQYYSQKINKRALERLLLERKLRDAVGNRELQLFYQPLLGLDDGRISGVEALLRWRHPEMGLLLPDAFIPLAEETDLIVRIGEWAVQTACKQIRTWHEQGLTGLRVAVNISPRQFSGHGLIDVIARALDRSGLEGCYLDLEITESQLMNDVESANETLHDLKTFGVGLSIDDFGTGYSSLSYLKRFPIDRLKIDKSFVRDIDNGADNEAIAMTITAMAHSMGLKVIAEGVENEVQLRYLSSHGCEEIQGFLFCRPLPTEKVIQPLQKFCHDSWPLLRIGDLRV